MSAPIKPLVDNAPLEIEQREMLRKINELVERVNKHDDEIDRLKTKTRPA